MVWLGTVISVLIKYCGGGIYDWYMKITRVTASVRTRKNMVTMLRLFCTVAHVKKLAKHCDIPYTNKIDTIMNLSRSDKLQLDIKFSIKPI